MHNSFQKSAGPAFPPKRTYEFPSQSKPTSGQKFPNEGTPIFGTLADPSNFPGGFPARPSQALNSRSFRPPPTSYSDGGTYIRDSKNVLVRRPGPKSSNLLAPGQNQSSPPPFQIGPFSNDAQQFTPPSTMRGDQPRTSSDNIRPMFQPAASSVPALVNNDPRRRSLVQYGDLQGQIQSRSPTFHSGNGGSSEDVNSFITPLTQNVTNDPRSRSPVPYVQAQKRSRSPTFPSNDPNGGFSEHPTKFIKPLTQPVIQSIPGSVANDSPSRSPTPVLSYNGGSLENPDAVQNSRRPSMSPPKTRSSNQFVPPSSQSNHTPSGYPKVVINRPISSPGVKRSKSPSSPIRDFQETSNATEDEENRELQARAKRIMRFKDERSEMGSDVDLKNQKSPAKRQLPVSLEKNKLFGEDATADVMVDSYDGKDHPPNQEDAGSSGLIVGLCLDMCPESERGERERKGDLDQFERVDGDRNQTSEFLAVKKYTRTAAREAIVIRPMSVLQKTMDYLLSLLDQPYDDRFLGLYNFLWDRMRAIRMDLRMQHIFDTGAIKMLEQMIRLHIVAMHELCEYTKGEGFSEGFDAHLNIEQMNKTSVELFHLYDDHRKKGKSVATEKEFRGYYALLKLDKHPGYKVEPGELSLDLAKMTPEIRQTSEVVFARDVARACRTCNFHAFFNLSQKASYLQACLMHAHFAKLRTLALAALHSGLQNNQGIPIAQIAEWLGMEEEYIEDLLEYHGFSIKEYEVPYMVKEGTFLNVDCDYPVKLSKLVNSKKSRTICEDVMNPCLPKSSSPAKIAKLVVNKGPKRKLPPPQSLEIDSGILENDEDMPEYVPSPRYDMQGIPSPRTPARQGVLSPKTPRLTVLPTFEDSPSSPGNRVGGKGEIKFDTLHRDSFGRNKEVEVKATPLPILPFNVAEANIIPQPILNVVEDIVQDSPEVEDIIQEPPELVAEPIAHFEENLIGEEVEEISYDQEVDEAKLKLILRIWKRVAQKKRESREQKQLAAITALSSLSLGPPIRHLDMQSSSPGDLDIEGVIRKRYEILEKSLSTLNASDAVAAELGAKNPDAKCLCWKILLLTPDSTSGDDSVKEISHFTAHEWLRLKFSLAGCNDNNDVDLLVSSPGVSVWSKWLPSRSGYEQTCYITVIKEITPGNHKDDAVAGASAAILPVSEHTDWEHQRSQLHNILMSLPPASRLPLLLVSGSCEDSIGGSSIAEKLRLHDFGNSCLSNFMVSFLKPRKTDQISGYYSDERLREGLKWLAAESPVQPLVCSITKRELVLCHLSSLLHSEDMSPNQCISGFNEAIHLSLQKAWAAVGANPNCWPCPEIALLDKACHEFRATSTYFPSIGWSSSTRTKPLFQSLTDLKLPPFEEDGNRKWDKKWELENCLFRYLAESSQMMSVEMAANEAWVMTQHFTKVDVHGSTPCIIPNWGKIFRRIFHWRLMELSDAPGSSVYVLARDVPFFSDSESFHRLEQNLLLPYTVSPTLDEMLAVSFIPPAPETFDDGEVTVEVDGGEDSESGGILAAVTHEITHCEPENGAAVLMPEAKTVALVDGLWELIARVDSVQNKIQKTLSFY